ncbi:hypothetical protein BJY04DRAFT_177246 [Aspergillus karnatakaensis]|uniref:uncharacterized protein n=1 Tax=Aspergillus karnatakaensis TaxID=1810916 RepID=UPI003CCD68D4
MDSHSGTVCRCPQWPWNLNKEVSISLGVESEKEKSSLLYFISGVWLLISSCFFCLAREALGRAKCRYTSCSAARASNYRVPRVALPANKMSSLFEVKTLQEMGPVWTFSTVVKSPGSWV